MELDMTKGSPSKLITKFIIPIIIGNIFQQLYSMVDTIIVGRFIGVDALAAVGATGSVSFLILGFTQGLTTGFTMLMRRQILQWQCRSLTMARHSAQAYVTH